MNKKKFIVGAFALMSMPIFAQSIDFHDTGRKWAGEFDALVKGEKVVRQQGTTLMSITPEQTLPAMITVNDAQAVVDFITEHGYQAEAITEQMVVAHIPGAFVKTLADLEEVLYINSSKQAHPLMHNVRPETGITKVQTGEGLETPFTGKGVVLGVIDQGFEYGHIAFQNRVVRYGTNTSGGALSTVAPNKDRLDNIGHATHVTNIAGGNKVEGVDDYGVATGADFVLVSSDFANASVLSQAKAIKKYAESQGQPWVINMSFGATMGPHDGTTDYDQAMSNLTGEGGIMVAAMGNSGGMKLHAYREIAEEGEKIYLNMKPKDGNPDQWLISQIWNTRTDGVSDLSFKLVVVAGGKVHYPTDAQLKRAGFYFISSVDPFNNRQFAQVSGSLHNLKLAMDIGKNTITNLLWEVEGQKGSSFHAWIDGYSNPSEFSTFMQSGLRCKAGDDEYLVGEVAATIPTAIAVSSYNADDGWLSHDGNRYNWKSGFPGEKGGLSSFSSKGPFLSAEPKPTVSAPGGVVLSAFSKNSDDFNISKVEISNVVFAEGQRYYYGMMCGTSMASPVVAGVVALWLEANPKLTYEQLKAIFKETSRQDDLTGAVNADNWNNEFGYGKIDAYEGLKMALALANVSGINETLNTEAPVTLQKNNDAWKVLFNNDESFATLQLYSLKGQLVQQQYVDSPRRGEEEIVSLAGLEPGVYLFRVNTTAHSMTRKLVVK